MQPTTPTTPPPEQRDTSTLEAMRSAEFRPRRSIWPGVLVAALIAAGVSAVFVSQYYDDRSLGSRLDATVAAAGSTVRDGVDGLRDGASGAAKGTTAAADRVADAVGDAAITAAVKTALAADPALSAIKIDVTTTQGAVLLEGPAPDERARHRAEVLATAPKGVARVDNRLVVSAATTPATTSRRIAAKAADTPTAPTAPAVAPIQSQAAESPALPTAPSDVAPAPAPAGSAPAQ